MYDPVVFLVAVFFLFQSSFFVERQVSVAALLSAMLVPATTTTVSATNKNK